MGAVVVLIIVVVVSTLIVRAGALALELTGVDKDRARFQALSAYTNTGYTTREAEEIVNFPVRRRIISVLIVLGYAGMVSVIASLAGSLLQKDPAHSVENLAIILGALFLLYRLASWRTLTVRIRRVLRAWLSRHYDLQTPTLEAMLKVGEGIGVVRLVIPEDSPLAGRRLAETEFKARKVQVLSIRRGEEVISVPRGDDVLLAGDQVICYGNLDAAPTLLK